jgi:hypothetical protein
MAREYTVDDEKNFIAWIAFNGQFDKDGAVFTEVDIEAYGTPIRRSCHERIQLLTRYAFGWRYRALPEGWSEKDRADVISYIKKETIPTIELTRLIQMGDIV